MAAALFDVLVRAPFDGVQVTVEKSADTTVEKLRNIFFSEDTPGTTIALTGQSTELVDHWAGGRIYTETVEISASTPTVGTEFDTLNRLHDWIVDAVDANPNLGGRAILAAVASSQFIQRPGSGRVIVEASVEIDYGRARAA